MPRKLYWADRLGVLIMADVPNCWGEPDAAMRPGVRDRAARHDRRDFNHPSIFSWVLFNEQWGLLTKAAAERQAGLPARDAGVGRRRVYRLAKSLDPTRLVEDNSPCCGGGHVKTDLNSWHMYLPGWNWEAQLDEASDSTFPGSTWNFEPAGEQDGEPMLNSECGNVWGYEGSHRRRRLELRLPRAIDEFRRHPKIAGWLYTEHHDVINEWNGYWRFDRSEKETGLGELVPGMTLRDLHAPLYVAVGDPETWPPVKPGETRRRAAVGVVPDRRHRVRRPLTLRRELTAWNTLGGASSYGTSRHAAVAFRPWMSRGARAGAGADAEEPRGRRAARARSRTRRRRAAAQLHDLRGRGRACAGRGDARRRAARARCARGRRPQCASAHWSLKQWTVLDGRKQNGAGSGYFEYRLPWPKGLERSDVAGATFLVEPRPSSSSARTGTRRRRHEGTSCAAGAPRPEPQPERLPDDGRTRVPERRERRA